MPRKSTASVAATDTNGDVSMVSEGPSTSSPKQPKDQKEKTSKRSVNKQDIDPITIDDLLLPRSIIQRIAKGVLPANTSIQKDAILALTKSATVFISHLADSANEQTDRKTIQSQDVIKALHEIEFDQVMQLGVMGRDGKRGSRLEREVESWEGNVRGKRAGYREKVKARQSTGTNGDTTFGTVDDELDGEEEEQEHEHENKRLRIDDEGQDREGSATGDISRSTQKLKLGVNGNSRIRDQDEDDDVEEDVQDDEDDSDEPDEEEEDEGQDQDEAQIAENSLETDDPDSHRRKDTLAPDGRVEVGNSDDDDDSDE